jgi:hypothetical protein
MKISFKSQLTFLVTCIVMASAAHAGSDRDRADRDRKLNDHARRTAYSCKSDKKPNKKPNKPQLPVINVACGDTVSESAIIGNDLNCPDATGFALRIIGDNITVNGNGRKIVAPKAAAGLYIQGDGIKVANFTSTDNPNGYGILAYNSPNAQISDNDFSRNLIGVMVYADQGVVDDVVVAKNKITQSVLFGVRTYFDAPGVIQSPRIVGNDLRSTGDYAIYVMASQFEVEGRDNNNLNGSNNGYYLKAGNFYIHDADYSKQLINKRHFFADSAQSVTIEDVDVTSRAKENGMQERTGVDLYRVANFSIKGLVSRGGDVGLILETEGGVSPSGQIKDCSFSNHKFAGIDIVSYDSTKYGKISISKTNFCEPTGTYDIFTHEGTSILNFAYQAQKSRCSDDRNDCRN